VTCLLCESVLAQVPSVQVPPPFPAPPPPLPEEIRPTPPPGSVLPPPPPPPHKKGEPLPLGVLVREIRITGSTVFPPEELAQVTVPYINRQLTSEDLEALRVAVTKFYIDRGYVTSGAIIPDQAVTEGIVTLQVIEGRLGHIEVEGKEPGSQPEWFAPSYIEDRIALGAGPPVNINALQERLLLLQETPGITRLNAELRPGVARGQSVLNVRVAEDNPIKAWLEFNNYLSPTVGSEQGLATVVHQNLTGHGDPLSFQYGQSSGVHPEINTRYAIPLTARDTTLILEYRKNDFAVIDHDFASLDIKSQSEIYGVTLRHPVYRTLNREFALALTGEHLSNRLTSTFDTVRAANPGVPGLRLVPGSEGDADGEVTSVSALRFSQELTDRRPNQVIAAFSRFSLGIDVLGSTNNKQSPTDASGKFFSWLGQAQWVRRFDPWRLQLIARLVAQFSNAHLFPLEQIAVGGRYSVRGYRENTLVRDNAELASLEARYAVWRSAAGEDVVQAAAFADFGRGTNTNAASADPDTLGSVGLGVIWNIMRGSRFEVYWGMPLNHISTSGGNLQDSGVHLHLVVEVL
jgi:hemolysin activation/secretion protein